MTELSADGNGNRNLTPDDLARVFDRENPEAAQIFKNVRKSRVSFSIMCALTAFCAVFALQPFFHKELWAIAVPLYSVAVVACILLYVSWCKMVTSMHEAAEILASTILRYEDIRYGQLMVTAVTKAHGVEFMVR